MTLLEVKEVPRPELTTTRAPEVMLPLKQLKSVNPDTELWAALQKMDRDGANQLSIALDHHVIGMLGREDVITLLRTLQELGIGITRETRIAQ
jgi:signal-transduction protein with cAMP-binding, CBS, and nucleotidyltransferase domain